MNLSDIRFVDLTASVWDKEASNQKEGSYVFTSKRYVARDPSRIGGDTLPDWFLTWERNTPSEISRSRANGYSLVTINDPFWPEGLALDSEGKYTFGDVVFVKCRLVDELERRMKREQLNQVGAKANLDTFAAGVRGDGGETIYQDMLQKMSK